MNLRKVVWALTMALICSLPLAVTTGCTGPPQGTGSNTTANSGNTTAPTGEHGSDLSDVDSNTTN